MSAATYKPILARMMSYLDDQIYDQDENFTEQQLGALTANDVMRWFNFETFGVPDPPNDHDMIPNRRTNTIKFWKKALSFFMPNRLTAWNAISGTGNPTRSRELNDLIRLVKRKEVRGQGQPAKARRSTNTVEYVNIVDSCKEYDAIVPKYGIPAMMNFQFHLIARIDCTTQVLKENVKRHDRFSFLLKAKLSWSKNVLEERDAPWQSILPAGNPVFCNFISLGIWLEVYAESSPTAGLTPYLFVFSDDVTIPEGGKKSKNNVQKFFVEEIFNRPDFADPGLLGSHSFRKFAATLCRQKGATKDEKDLRGRWKS